MRRRYAVYYAPASDDPLWAAGCAWLGRDPAGGQVGAPPKVSGIEAITAEARKYGFHATLKPPMRLREGMRGDDVLAALREMAACASPFALPPLAVADFHGFLCLRETRDSARLQALSDAAVAGLDGLRAASDEPEMARRRGPGLSPAREANLRRWGYPDVFATWFFHMTLTRRLDPVEVTLLKRAAEAWFSAALAAPRDVRDVCLFEQEDGGPFMLTARAPLGGALS